MRAVEEAFSRYYRRHSASIYVPEVERREIMLMSFGGGVLRHLSFRSQQALRDALVRENPMHAYHSVASYRNPGSPEMREKGILDADLLFDVDADELPDPRCSEGLAWFCGDCGESGEGPAPPSCPGCGGAPKTLSWPTEGCLEAAKEHALRVIDAALGDLGAERVSVSFTGHRGYHVAVGLGGEKPLLGGFERMEVARLVSGRGIDPSELVRVEGSTGALRVPTVGEGGWRGRYARLLRSVLEGDPPEWVSESEVSRVSAIPGLRAALSSGYAAGPVGKKTVELLRRMVVELVEFSGAVIDEQVTGDPQRMTRIPNSLHGKTGLRAVPLSPDGIRSFRPLRDAVALDGEEVTVEVRVPVPRFRLGGEGFGPLSPGDSVRLPAYAAAMIILRGRGVEA